MNVASIRTIVRVGLAGLLLGVVAPLRAEAKAAPQVSVSLRGIVGQSLEQGEPWRVAVRLDLPRGSKETLSLAPAAGTWADAVAVELHPATGSAVAARAEAVGKPESARATLDAKQVAGGLWRFSPEAMRAVAPGNYVLRVRLAIAGGTGWTGTVSAREIPVAVVPPASVASTQRITNRAQDLLLIGQLEAAAATVDAGLKTSPRDYSLLKVRAQIAERAGNPLAAIVCLNAARFSTEKKIAGQPPAEDIEMRARLEKSRHAAGSATVPPAWTWPPAEVLDALSAEAKKSSFIPATPPDRSSGARTASATASTSATASAPAAPVVAAKQTSTAAAPAGTPTVSSNAAVSTSAVLAGPLPGVVVPGAELNDAKIIADPSGQWASAATASSQYSAPGYSAAQAVGVPNIPLGMAGDNSDSWCPAAKNEGAAWLELTFATPVHASEVRVRQNNAPGAMAKVELIEADGTSHLVWEGADPAVAPAVREITWFAIRVPQTTYLVAKVKLTLNLAAVPGWNQIDAVQLVGTAP